MGYFGKLKEKSKALQLRRQGYSYSEILKEIQVSKDTLSRWCKDIVLTEKQKHRLIKNKSMGQKKGSLVAAENKRKKRQEEINKMNALAKKEIGSLSEREEFIIGVMLYAGEGTKMDGKGGFANADPKLLKFMRKWFVKYAKISTDNLRGRIWLHEGLDEKKAKTFWSKTIKIPKEKFFKTYVAKNKKSSKKFRKNLHSYGIGAIIFYDTLAHRKIMGWISAVFDAKIGSEINIPR